MALKFALAVYFSLMLSLAWGQAKKCHVVAFSDVHVAPGNIFGGPIITTPAGNVVNHGTVFQQQLNQMIQEAQQAISSGSANCVSVLFNGDPFQRNLFEALPNDNARAQAISDFTRQVRSKFETVVGSENLQLIANCGDHEIRKLPAMGSEAWNNLARENPSVAEKYQQMINEQGWQVKIKDGVPVSYTHPNGDDVMMVDEANNGYLRQGYEGGGARYVGVDPRVGVGVELMDGRKVVLAHIDNVATRGEAALLNSLHSDINQSARFNPGSLLGAAPDPNDARNKSAFREAMVITSDSHISRVSIAGSLESPEASRLWSEMTGERVTINTGSTSSGMRNENALNPNTHVIIDPSGNFKHVDAQGNVVPVGRSAQAGQYISELNSRFEQGDRKFLEYIRDIERMNSLDMMKKILACP